MPLQNLHSLDFASIQVRDLQKSKQFYTQILGFEPVDEARPNAVVFKQESGAIFAIRTPIQPFPDTISLGQGVSFWFNVVNVDNLHDNIIQQGGRVLSEPEDGAFGRQFMIADSDGYIIVFHQVEE